MWFQTIIHVVNQTPAIFVVWFFFFVKCNCPCTKCSYLIMNCFKITIKDTRNVWPVVWCSRYIVLSSHAVFGLGVGQGEQQPCQLDAQTRTWWWRISSTPYQAERSRICGKLPSCPWQRIGTAGKAIRVTALHCLSGCCLRVATSIAGNTVYSYEEQSWG